MLACGEAGRPDGEPLVLLHGFGGSGRTFDPLLDGLGDRRSSPRHPASDQRMVCRLSDGSSLFVRVLDRSVDGISVDAPRKPPVGSSIHVGRERAVVIRHTARGFVAIYEPDAAQSQPSSRLRAV